MQSLLYIRHAVSLFPIWLLVGLGYFGEKENNANIYFILYGDHQSSYILQFEKSILQKEKGYFVSSKEKSEEEKTRLSGLCPNGVLAPPWSTQQSLRFPNLSPFLHYLAPSERN